MTKTIAYGKGTIEKDGKKKTFIREFLSDGSIIWHIPKEEKEVGLNENKQ